LIRAEIIPELRFDDHLETRLRERPVGHTFRGTRLLLHIHSDINGGPIDQSLQEILEPRRTIPIDLRKQPKGIVRDDVFSLRVALEKVDVAH
jgi:hypothetical protein